MYVAVEYLACFCALSFRCVCVCRAYVWYVYFINITSIRQFAQLSSRTKAQHTITFHISNIIIFNLWFWSMSF